MALRYLLDEQLDPVLWRTIQRHNAAGVMPLDVVYVGDGAAPPKGTSDPDLLIWAEKHRRVLVTHDYNSMQTHLDDHLQAGRHSPGVLYLPRKWKPLEVVDSLVFHDQLGDPADYADQARFIH